MAPPKVKNNSTAAETRRKTAEAERKRPEVQTQSPAEKAKQAADGQRNKASDAQKTARTDAKTASDAQDKAKTAKKNMDSAKEKASNAQSTLETKLQMADRLGPRLSEKDRKELVTASNNAKDLKGDADKATDVYKDAKEKADKATDRANDSRKTAINEANKALTLQKDANVKAKAEGKPQPFATANEVRDVFDAGSLDTKAQEKLFGTKSVVSAQEAARSDAKTVSEATQQSPAAGAQELRRQLKGNNDPAYRDTLMKESKGNIDAMTSGLGRPDVTQEQADQIVSDLSNAADMTGPQASRDMADSFRNAQPDNDTGKAVQDKLNKALKANADDPAVARVAKGLADGFREDGRYDKADAITQLDPKLAKAAAQSPGQTKARDEVDIQNAKESKETVAQQQKQTDKDTRDQVDDLFKAAQDKKPPKGFEAVETKDPNRVEFVSKDKNGGISQRIAAERDDKNNIRLDTSVIDPKTKQATRQVVTSSGPEGTTTSQTAAWTPAKGEDLRSAPSIEDLKKSRDKSVSVEENSWSRDKGDLVTTSYKQGGGAVEGSETRFSQQKGEDGLDDKFKDKFNEDKPIDKVETKSYSIPAPGEKGPDDKLKEPTYTRELTLSQGEGRNEVQATSTASKSLKSDDGFKVDKGPRNSEDLKAVREKLQSKDGEDGEKFDGDKDNPKQWVLEQTDGNKYRSQTFLEGKKDISVVTERTAKGNSVQETVTGKVFSTEKGKEGEPVEISSKSNRTYNDKGQIVSAQSKSKGADGVNTEQDYKRTDKKGPGGRLQVNESFTTTSTPPGGKPTKVTSERTRRESDAGVLQLVNASKSVEGPDGSAKVQISPEKTEQYVNGKEVPKGQESKLGEKEKALLTVAKGEMAKELYTLATTPEFGSEKDDLLKKSDALPYWKQGVSAGKDVLGLVQGGLEFLDERKQGAGNQSGTQGPGDEPGTQGPGTEGGSDEPRPQGAGDSPENATPPSTLARLAKASQYGAESLGIVGNTIGAVTASVDLANNISKGNYLAAAQNVADIGGGVTGGIQSGINLNNLLKGTPPPPAASGLRNAFMAGGKFGAASAVFGAVAGGMDIAGGIKDGDKWQVAKGGVSLAGALGAGVAAGAIGGPPGMFVGAGIGLGVAGAGLLFDKLSDKDHQIADVKI